jgi:hypothetical protein
MVIIRYQNLQLNSRVSHQPSAEESRTRISRTSHSAEPTKSKQIWKHQDLTKMLLCHGHLISSLWRMQDLQQVAGMLM